MKKILKELFAFVLIRLHNLTKAKSDGILSIYFHNPSKNLFTLLIKWLIANNYKFITTKELEQFIKQQYSDANLVCITFDDGWQDNLELIDVINLYKIPITIFIPTAPVVEGNYWFEFARIKGQQKLTNFSGITQFKNAPGNEMNHKVALLKEQYKLSRTCITLDELRRLNANNLVTIGSHTISHPILNNCSYEMKKNELACSRTILENWINAEVNYIAYPNGNYDDEVLNIVKECGYTLGFTTKAAKINLAKVDPLLIPRYSINDDGGIYENICKILGIWQKFIRPK